MRVKPILIGIVGALGCTSVVPAYALDSLKGEIVDLACYMGHPNPEKMRGPSHRKCAETCLKKGMPIGLVTDDKQVYLLLEDHDNPNPYAQLKEKAAETVTVEGNKVSVGGSQGFVVETVK
ncbi:MAG TPA: hypothetical protein VFD84_19225 [Candidatus Binatia bacterium]|jgi:hypothetical protein|nr:hypothetical protein [Candidatus Binatia bacterium]